MRFTPGPGVGGHCLPIDPSYLSWAVEQRLGRPFRFVELANDINDHMPDYVVHSPRARADRRGVALAAARVLVLGLAYKRNSSDARESPALAVVGSCSRRAAPTSPSPTPTSSRTSSTTVAARRVDARRRARSARPTPSCCVTDHDAFDCDLVVANARYVLDTRHCWTGDAVEHL